jgi:hypothetical protein
MEASIKSGNEDVPAHVGVCPTSVDGVLSLSLLSLLIRGDSDVNPESGGSRRRVDFDLVDFVRPASGRIARLRAAINNITNG